MCWRRKTVLDNWWQTIKGFPEKLLLGFKSLNDSPRDLYLILLLKFLESYNYFTLSLLYVLFLTDEFNIKDRQAGTSYGVWGSLIFLYGVVLAGAIDYLGVKICLTISFICSAVARLLLAMTRSPGFAIFLLYVPAAIGYALGIPVLTIAVKRYTTEGNRGTAFGLFYSVMNVGALITGFAYDFATQRLRHGLGRDPGSHAAWSDGYRVLVLSGCFTSVMALIVTYFVNEKNMLLEGDTESSGKTGVEEAAKPRGVAAVRSKARQVWSDIVAVLCMLEFWKFFVATLITTNMRQLFRHYDATMPKYIQRSFGCHAPAGAIYSINPFMIILLVPLVGAATTHVAHFDMIHYGSYLYSASPFWMAAVQKLWATVVFSVQLSLGEAVWSPRWYDYSMSVAPEGREGMFTALASAPLFLAKLPTGLFSGWLLESLCPPNVDCIHSDQVKPSGSHCQGQEMWAAIGGVTMTSPLLIFLLRRWLRPRPSRQAAVQSGRTTEDQYHPPRDEAYAPLVNREGSLELSSQSQQLLPMQSAPPLGKENRAM